jgi:uncharacterized protein YecE (DUF72 family)
LRDGENPHVAQLYAGTSGFSYTTWRPGFYPAGSRPKDFLRFYAERFPAVELNTSFYQLPSEEQLQLWAEQTPPDFRFAVKMNRRITHFGRIELVPTFCEQIRALGDRLGPVLVQLPPTRPRDDGWLRLMLDSIDPDLKYAFEFRNETWADVDVGHHARVGSLEGEADFRYLRLREPPYDEAALVGWGERLTPIVDRGVDVFAFFKHEDPPDAPAFARRLLELAAVKRSA